MPSEKSDEKEQTNVLVGLGAGGTAGALAGALIGGVTGGPIGAIAGAAIGGGVGSVSGGAAAYGDVESEFRHEYESSATTARGVQHWDTISPAYRYGWESHDRPEYQGKAWSQVQSDLEKGWTGPGHWTDYEPHVRSAWEHRARRFAPVVEPPVPESVSKDHEVFQGAEPAAALAIGGTSGAYLGGVMGLLMGGPIGMAVGGTLGTVAGAAIAQGAMSDWHESVFKAHHESKPEEHTQPWERARPAYQLGWEAHDHVETANKPWDEIRPELARKWQGPGSFAEYEIYVKHGWSKRMPPGSGPDTTSSA